MFMLDTGGHTATINSIAFTPDGTHLLSASDDKTIRVWDLTTGKTVRTIRGAVGPGHEGKFFSMALSNDGNLLAAGGKFPPIEAGILGDPLSYAVRLYDFHSGRLICLLTGHGDTVSTLAFSPNGRHLISGDGGLHCNAIIWDVTEQKGLHLLEGHEGDLVATAFTPDGLRAVTASTDHEMRLWRVADGSLLRVMTGHSHEVSGLAVAADGLIASGDGAGEIRLWDGQNGAFLKTLARQETSVASLSFSPNGKLLLSGTGEYGDETSICHVFDVDTGETLVSYEYDNSVLATAICPDGRWAATAGGDDNQINIWELTTGEGRLDANGNEMVLDGVGMPVYSAAFSPDGQRIAWGHLWDDDGSLRNAGYGPLEFAITLPTRDKEPTVSPITAVKPVGWFRRLFSKAPSKEEWCFGSSLYGDWSLQHEQGGVSDYDAILNICKGKQLVASVERFIDTGCDHTAYTFTSDGKMILSGGSHGVLTAYDLNGNEYGQFVGHEDNVRALACSRDGRYLVSGADDQTLRLWNLRTRELLVSLFHGVDGRWVMWMPQGYYVASPGGASLIGWHLNRGLDHAAVYITAAQLRQDLNRPEIVAQAIALASTKEAVARAPDARRTLVELLNTAGTAGNEVN